MPQTIESVLRPETKPRIESSRESLPPTCEEVVSRTIRRAEGPINFETYVDLSDDNEDMELQQGVMTALSI